MVADERIALLTKKLKGLDLRIRELIELDLPNAKAYERGRIYQEISELQFNRGFLQKEFFLLHAQHKKKRKSNPLKRK